MASLDAPLLNLGGITAENGLVLILNPEGPHLYSWAINNHWMVNFKASQDGLIPFALDFRHIPMILIILLHLNLD